MKTKSRNDHPRVLHTETVVFEQDIGEGKTRQVAGAGYSTIRGATIVWAPPGKEGYCSSGAVASEVVLACIQRLEQINDACAQTRQSQLDHDYSNALVHLREGLKALKDTPEYRNYEPLHEGD